MCAASDGHAEVVKQLVAHGADVTAKNKVTPEQLPCLLPHCTMRTSWLGATPFCITVCYMTQSVMCGHRGNMNIGTCMVTYKPVLSP